MFFDLKGTKRPEGRWHPKCQFVHMYLFLYFSQPIGIFSFKGFNIIYYYFLTAKVQEIPLVSVQGVEEMRFSLETHNMYFTAWNSDHTG